MTKDLDISLESKAFTKLASSTLKLAYSGVQEIRLKHLLWGLQKSIDNCDEEKYFNYLESDFALNNLFDFVRNSIDCSSEIARYAISKLYVEYHDFPSTKLPYNKMIILRALSDMDDLDAEIFLETYSFAKNKDKQPNKEGFTNLRITKEEFDNILVNGIKVDYLQAMRLFNSLYSKGILDEASVVIGQNTSVNYSFSDVSDQLFTYLEFGRSIYLTK